MSINHSINLCQAVTICQDYHQTMGIQRLKIHGSGSPKVLLSNKGIKHKRLFRYNMESM